MQMKEHLWKIGLIISNHTSLSATYSFRRGIGILSRMWSHLVRFSVGKELDRVIFSLIIITLKNWTFNSPNQREIKYWLGFQIGTESSTWLHYYMGNFMGVLLQAIRGLFIHWLCISEDENLWWLFIDKVEKGRSLFQKAKGHKWYFQKYPQVSVAWEETQCELNISQGRVKNSHLDFSSCQNTKISQKNDCLTWSLMSLYVQNAVSVVECF